MKMIKTKENKEESGSEEKNEFAATAAPFATLAALVLATLALTAFSTQANANLEPAAVIEFAFGLNATAGETTLSLDGFKTGLAGLPNYVEPAKRDFEVRTLNAQGAVLHSFWLSDPRYSYYDVVGANGSLSGGKKFDANARFFVVVPVAAGARYAAVFDSAGSKLIAIDLRTGAPVEEKEWKEIPLKTAEERGLDAGDLLAAAAALLLAILIILGIAVFRKARKTR